MLTAPGTKRAREQDLITSRDPRKRPRTDISGHPPQPAGLEFPAIYFSKLPSIPLPIIIECVTRALSTVSPDIYSQVTQAIPVVMPILLASIGTGPPLSDIQPLLLKFGVEGTARVMGQLNELLGGGMGLQSAISRVINPTGASRVESTPESLVAIKQEEIVEDVSMQEELLPVKAEVQQPVEEPEAEEEEEFDEDIPEDFDVFESTEDLDADDGEFVMRDCLERILGSEYLDAETAGPGGVLVLGTPEEMAIQRRNFGATRSGIQIIIARMVRLDEKADVENGMQEKSWRGALLEYILGNFRKRCVSLSFLYCKQNGLLIRNLNA